MRVKYRMKKFIPEKSGVYLLTNIVNGKIYVGKAVNIRDRVRKHKSSQHRITKDDNSRIIQAIKKYGWNSFEISFLEVFDDISNDELLKKESEWIIKLQSTDGKIGYNILTYDTDWTGMHHSEETKRKLSLAHTGRWGGENNPFFGRTHSRRSRKKISEHHVDCSGTKNAFYGKCHSNDVKAKMSLTRKGRDCPWLKKPVMQFDMNGVLIAKWGSAREASIRIMGKKEKASSITSVCRGDRNSAFGFRWAYDSEKSLKKLLTKDQNAVG